MTTYDDLVNLHWSEQLKRKPLPYVVGGGSINRLHLRRMMVYSFKMTYMYCIVDSVWMLLVWGEVVCAYP